VPYIVVIDSLMMFGFGAAYDGAFGGYVTDITNTGNRARVQSIISIVVGVATVLTSALAGVIIDRFGYPVFFICIGCLMIIAGIAVVQDSDLNWVCPPTEAFTDRAVKIFGDMVTNLRNHPSILCWVCMNEPDIWMLGIQMGMMKKVEPMPVSMMNERPGPQLVAALKKLDPTRPYIKGSIQSFDPESGDLHNYFGSLIGEQTRYTDIYGMPEKLNTEFGFDAPAGVESLRKVPEIYDRLKTLIETGKLEELQHYQYRLLKYFIEHYRMMKYRPNSGYFQFLFTDICPQSLRRIRLVGRVETGSESDGGKQRSAGCVHGI